MKKHLALGLFVLVGLGLLTSSAAARRPGCQGLTGTEWTSVGTVSGIHFVVGTAGDDVFDPARTSHNGPFVILGLEGNDIICGSEDADVIIGGPGHDVIRARGGADTVHAGRGNDRAHGGPGADRLNGGPGVDIMVGGRGPDILHGGRGDDFLRGGPGRDEISGDEGDDTLDSRDNDILDPNEPSPRTPPPQPTPPATPTVRVDPMPTTEPAPRPKATSVPTATAVPTAMPDPTPKSSPDPTPASPAFPADYAENLALIQEATATASHRKAMVWDLFQRHDFALNAGNPNQYTPSADLEFGDYVHHRGSQYGPERGRGPNGGVFHVTCQFSHLAFDDPIVFPDQPGRSHLHMFFGNTHSNAYSTSDTILNEGGSTCSRGELNRTSYWIPAAIDAADNVLIPDQFMVYYESYDEEWDTLQAFPEGFKLVNGNAMATAVQPDIADFGAPVITWKCGWYGTAQLTGQGSSSSFGTTVPECDDSTYSHVEMQIKWPFCWDGQQLDSTNHQDHVVFPQAGQGFFFPGTCPSTHPVTLPRLTYRVHFSTATISGPTSEILLSSDVQPGNGELSPNGVSGHGDYFGGWNRDLLEGMVSRCILGGQECDEWHYGTPGGEQAAVTMLEGGVITPSEVQEYCPLRTTFDGNLYNVAYCRPAG